MIMEAIMRGWENFIVRPSGPLGARFYTQTGVAILVATIAGIKDAREGKPPYLWAIFTNSTYRKSLMREGWKELRLPFFVSVILDAIYQLMSHRGIYLLEMLFTAFFLALLPYLLFRGPVNRLASFIRRNKRASKVISDHDATSSETSARLNTDATKKEEIAMSDKPEKNDWSKPAAMAIPKGGFIKKEEGRYGQIYPKTPANYGFTIIAKIKSGREDIIRQYGKTIEETIAKLPDALAVLKLHYLRWVLFDIKGDTYFMYQGIFDTDFDKYTEDAVALFTAYGINTVFENLEDFPEDWKTNTPAFVKFVRDHQCPSFLEYAEYPYVGAGEIKKALRLKDAFSKMLDQMQ